MSRVSDIRIEYRRNPVGIDVAQPRLSWQITADRRNVRQAAYRIQVARDAGFSAMVWDSGVVTSDASFGVEYQGPDIAPRTRYYCRVQVTDQDGRTSPWSAPAFWETGFLGEDWQAEWITADTPETEVSPLIRWEFPVQDDLASARLYVTALGLYEARVNGTRVGDAVLTPGWTSYHHQLQYQTYDVADLLVPGANAIAVVLGNGWYRGNLRWVGERHLYGDRRALRAELRLRYRDGREEVVASGPEWRAAEGPILMSEIYHGETYDARREWLGWDGGGFDDRGWERVRILDGGPGNLVGQISEPVRAVETIRPQALIRTPAGETVIDMGQNMVGWVRVRARGAAGSRVVLQHAEVLDRDGNFYTENLRSARQTVTYILRGTGEDECFEPHFTFQGFRYVRVVEFPGAISLERFAGRVIQSDLDPTGEFACSDPLVNQLQQNIVWSQRGNFVDVPTDCPQRDERLGWTGDAQVFIRTALFNMDAAAFFTKWLRDLRYDQDADGGVPSVIPNVMRRDDRHSSAAWGDAATICPWTLYQTYGDRRLLAEQYPSMVAWVEYIRRQGTDELLWNTGFHYGDWLALDAEEGSYVGATPRELIATAFYAYSARLVTEAAEALGKRDDADRYRTLHGRIVQRFREVFLTADGSLQAQTQTAHVLALAFHLTETSGRERLAARLAELIEEHGGHLTTGFVGTPYVLSVLSAYGYHSLACRLVRRTEYPSWLYAVKAGATTIWEHWDGLKPDGSFWSADMNSFNHYAYGSVGEWLYRVLAGLDGDGRGPGYRRIRITPHPDPAFTYAFARYAAIVGPIRSGWRREGETLIVEAEIPPNTTALVQLPGAEAAAVTEGERSLDDAEGIIAVTEEDHGTVVEIGSGSYRFRYPLPRR